MKIKSLILPLVLVSILPFVSAVESSSEKDDSDLTDLPNIAHRLISLHLNHPADYRNFISTTSRIHENARSHLEYRLENLSESHLKQIVARYRDANSVDIIWRVVGQLDTNVRYYRRFSALYLMKIAFLTACKTDNQLLVQKFLELHQYRLEHDLYEQTELRLFQLSDDLFKQGVNLAAEHDQIDTVKFLLDVAQEAHFRADLGEILRIAASKHHLDLLKMLILEYNADPNSEGGNAFLSAVAWGNREAVKLLLDKLTNPILVSTGLSTATKQGDYPMFKYLLTKITHRNFLHVNFGYMLLVSCSNGYVDIAREVLRFPIHDEFKNMAFGRAIKNQQVAIVQLLLEHGQPAHELALITAVTVGNVEIVNLLLNRGADMNASSSNSLSILGLAVEFHHEEVVGELLHRGVTVTRHHLENALSITENASIFKMLWEHYQYDIYLVHDMIRMAVTQNNLSVLRFLVESFHLHDDLPVISAARLGHVEILDYLMSQSNFNQLPLDEQELLLEILLTESAHYNQHATFHFLLQNYPDLIGTHSHFIAQLLMKTIIPKGYWQLLSPQLWQLVPDETKPRLPVNTWLADAAEKGRYLMVKKLILYLGADPNGNSGAAFKRAHRNGHTRTLSQLMKLGAYPVIAIN